MKEKLKKKFSEEYWVQTYELRAADLKNCLPAVTVHTNWPFLFKPNGVIFKILAITFIIKNKFLWVA